MGSMSLWSTNNIHGSSYVVEFMPLPSSYMCSFMSQGPYIDPQIAGVLLIRTPQFIQMAISVTVNIKDSTIILIMDVGFCVMIRLWTHIRTKAMALHELGFHTMVW